MKEFKSNDLVTIEKDGGEPLNVTFKAYEITYREKGYEITGEAERTFNEKEVSNRRPQSVTGTFDPDAAPAETRDVSAKDIAAQLGIGAVGTNDDPKGEGANLHTGDPETKSRKASRLAAKNATNEAGGDGKDRTTTEVTADENAKPKPKPKRPAKKAVSEKQKAKAKTTGAGAGEGTTGTVKANESDTDDKSSDDAGTPGGA